MILYLGTASFGNEFLFTELKENAPLIKYFGPMYIDFDEYPRYSGRIYVILEKNMNEKFNVIMVMIIFRLKNCTHGLIRKVGQ